MYFFPLDTYFFLLIEGSQPLANMTGRRNLRLEMIHPDWFK